MERILKTTIQSLDITHRQYWTFEDFGLVSGETLESVTIAFETYGRLNSQQSNAVLVCHALSGDAHAAGLDVDSGKTGWWDDMIGPGKAFDTDRYFVISSNVLGGCQGTTGPLSINPLTGEHYGIEFPQLTIRDMVIAQSRLIEHLGISRLIAVAGGSMGGMQALEWAITFPERLEAVIPIATTTRHTPQQIAFNEVGRQAILADPHFNNGQYYAGNRPERGLAMARMIGHITYMSDRSMADKFGRRMQPGSAGNQKFAADFEVANYLQHKGDDFVKRFDANSYLYITKAIDMFDLAGEAQLADVLIAARQLQFLIISFKSDWLYPAYHSRELVKGCKLAGIDVTYCEINSTYGHDAFLLETDEETMLISNFLRKLCPTT